MAAAAARLILVLALLGPSALAQDAPAPEPWVIVVEAGETFPRPGADASLRGPGRLEVHGVLDLQGSPDAPAVLSEVAIVLHGAGPHRLAHARLAAPGDVGVDLRAGALAVHNATFEGGGVALRAGADARLEVADAAFLDQGVAGVSLREGAGATLARVAFHGAGGALRVDSSGPLDVRDAAFRGRATHVAIDAHAGWEGAVRNASFGPAGEGLVVRAQGPARLWLEETRFRGLGAGLVLQGAGLVAEGEGDTFLANRVAVRVEDASVTLRRPLFANNTRDVEGPVTLDAPTFLREPDAPAPGGAEDADASAAPPAPAPALDARLLLGIALLAFIALSVAAYAARGRLRRAFVRARARLLPEPLRDEARARIAETLEGAAPMHADDVARRAGVGPELAEALLAEMADEGAVQVGGSPDAARPPRYRLTLPPPPPGAPAPDLASPLSPQEARVLRDLADHPGTPQSAIAQRLGLSRQALHYHVKKLEGRGLVTKISKGRETHCYARAEALSLLASAAPAPAPAGVEAEPRAPEPDGQRA